MPTSQENLPPTTSLKLEIPGKGAKLNSKPTSTKQQKPKPPPKPPKQMKWSAENSAELIRVLTEQAAGNQADNAWKGCVWTAAELALRGSELVSGGAKKDTKKCNGHWDKVHIHLF
jgi:hypothetical protein